MVVTIVVVRTLGEHRFGQWSTIFALSDLAGYVGELGIDRVTVRQAAADSEREPEYLGALVSIRTMLSIPVTLAFLAITLAISSDATMRISSVVLAVLLLLPPLSSLTVVFQLRVRNDLSMLVLTLNSLIWTGAAVAISVLSGGMIAMAWHSSARSSSPWRCRPSSSAGWQDPTSAPRARCGGSSPASRCLWASPGC